MRSALLVAVALAALCLAASALPSFPTSPWNLNIDGSGVESSVASWTTPSGQTLVYWTTFNGLVLAVDAASGVGAWFTSDVGEMIRSTPAVYAFNATNAAVYLVGGDAQLWVPFHATTDFCFAPNASELSF
jgi:outer membrane protein assembly factor BamB